MATGKARLIWGPSGKKLLDLNHGTLLASITAHFLAQYGTLFTLTGPLSRDHLLLASLCSIMALLPQKRLFDSIKALFFHFGSLLSILDANQGQFDD